MKKLIRKLILTFIILITTYNTQANEIKIKKAIQEVNFDKAISDICLTNKQSCKILKDKRIYSYLKKHYKEALYSIALRESRFKYKKGFKNKYDRGYFQINIKIWTPKKIKKLLGIKTTIWSLTHRPKVQTKVALRIWLYNCALYIKKYKKYPKSLPEYISLYHNPNKISKTYTSLIRKVVYKVKL